MENKLILGVISTLVIVTLLGSVLVPVIDSQTEGEKITNDGAGWIRMDYVTGKNYDVGVSFDNEGNVRVDSGVPGQGILNTQTHAADEDTILFASSEISMWLQDGVINILGKDSSGNAIFDQITEYGDVAAVLVDGDGSQYRFNTDVATTLNASSWAYVPKSTGNFGFFDAGTPVDMKDYPVAAVGGGFAGVYAFNGGAMYGLPLQMQTELDEDGKLIGGTWVKAAPEELNTMEFDPSTISIQPLDPSIIDIDPIDFGGGAQLMSVPIPSYTDGDWGYNTMTVGGDTVAKIVSYSGAGGDIVVPNTVGGYAVYQFGIGEAESTVFDNGTLAANSTLTFNEGLVLIGRDACYACTNLTGDLIIPDGVTTIGNNAFSGCSGFNGNLHLSSSLTSLGSYSFMNCTNLTGNLIIPDGVTAIGNQTFQYCSKLTGVVALPSGVTSIGTTAFANCTSLTGVVIPSSVTSIGQKAFQYCSAFDNVVIMSNATPGANAFQYTGILELLDLSEVSYAGGSYGLNANITVEDTIGDAIGYVSFVEIGSDAPLGGSAAAILIIIPVVIVSAIIFVMAAAMYYKRAY